MTGEILAFPAAATPEVEEPCDPYISGPVRCLRCRHEWVAVAPAGTTNGLNCSACNCDTGVFVTLIWPPAGTSIWTCKCGGELFALTPAGAPLCVRCGLRATSWVDG